MTSHFEAFAARKTAEAIAARLEPWVTEVERVPAACTAIGNAWSRERFGGDFYLSPPPENRPAVNLVYVESREGNTVAKDPAALGGGETDKHVVYEGLSRVAADAVMAGAETIRGGRLVLSVWHPQLVALRSSLGLPRHPVQVVATLRGVDIDEGLLFNEPSLRVILITVGACADLMARAIAPRPWITPLVMQDAGELSAALARLRTLGIARVSCIGGRTLARQLIDGGLVEDLYLTKSPRSGGEPNTPLSERPLEGTVILKKAGTGADAGVTFEHRQLIADR
jgi:5-amino-6-(5-phosphoribosylamino)uracil reductase